MTIRRMLSAVAVSVLFLLSSATVALAQDGPDYVGSQPPVGASEVSGIGGGTGGGGGGSGLLPLTGISIALLLILGVGSIVIGRSLRDRRERAAALLSKIQ
jgi:hypothetical protein